MLVVVHARDNEIKIKIKQRSFVVSWSVRDCYTFVSTLFIRTYDTRGL
jgi:hypothetical protein